MRVSGLDSNSDWSFGRGKANYKTNDAAIGQNVVTRLKSFKNDCFVDTEANIDWISLLGRKDAKELIYSEVERVTLATEGVASIDRLQITQDVNTRKANIEMQITTLFGASLPLQIPVGG